MAGDSVGIWAITGHLAACYGNMQMYEDADRVYDEFFSMHIYDTLKYARRRLNYAKDLIRRETKRPAQSIEIIEDVAKTFPKAMTVEAYCIYAYALQISGNSDAASSIIQQLEAMNGSTDIIRVWRYRICREQGQYKQAIEDLEHSIMVQDSVILASIQQSLLRTQRDYLNAKTELLKKENKIVRQKIYLTVVVSFVLLGGLFFLYIRRRASYSKRIEELSSLYLASQQMIDLQNLKTDSLYVQLAEKDSDILSLRKKYAAMYKAQYKTLNDLCAAYLSPIKKDRKDVLYDVKVEPSIDNVRSALDKLFAKVYYIKPQITSFVAVPTGGLFEKGETITAPTFTWAYNKDIKTQTLTDIVLTDNTDRTATFGNDITTNKTFTLSASDGEKSVTKSISYKFVDPIYTGVITNGTAIDEPTLTGLDKEITEAKTIEKAITSNFQTIVFASVLPLADLINANGFSVLSSAVKENLTLTNGTVFNVYKLENINVTGFKYTLKF